MPNPSQLWTRKLVISADPAANAELSQTVPTGKWWDLSSVTVVLVQGATQTPQPLLILDDGTNVLYEAFGAAAAQGASTTQRYVWARDLPVTTAGTTPNIHSTAPLPSDMILGPGFRIRTSTLGIGANTDYGAANLYVIEYG